MYTLAVFEMDNQQGPSVQPRELCSILCNKLNGKVIWKRILNNWITLLYNWS